MPIKIFIDVTYNTVGKVQASNQIQSLFKCFKVLRKLNAKNLMTKCHKNCRSARRNSFDYSKIWKFIVCSKR